MEAELRLGAESSYLTLPARLRERHLAEETNEADALVQAIGDRLRIWICSRRDDLRIHVPLCEWRAGPPRDRSIFQWGINVQRWRDSFITDGKQIDQAGNVSFCVPVEYECVEGVMPCERLLSE